MSRQTDRYRVSRTGGRVSRLLTVAFVALLIGSAVATVGTASATEPRTQPGESESALVVALEATGDATVAVTVGFDLTDEADRAAFESLRENETKQNRLETRTERRFRAVVAETANATDREMAIETTDVSFETVDGGDRGLVSVSAGWQRFAATEDGRLTIAEPFASGFTAEQPVVLKPPEGYALARSTPEPSERGDGRVRWNTNTSLEGYEAVLAPSGQTGSGTGDSQPGFGLGTAVVAITGGVWLHRRR